MRGSSLLFEAESSSSLLSEVEAESRSCLLYDAEAESGASLLLILSRSPFQLNTNQCNSIGLHGGCFDMVLLPTVGTFHEDIPCITPHIVLILTMIKIWNRRGNSAYQKSGERRDTE